MRVPDAGIVATLRKANQTLGSEYFRTPRNIVRSFFSSLNLLDQNPATNWSDILEHQPLHAPGHPLSMEEELANGSPPARMQTWPAFCFKPTFLIPGWVPLFTNWILRFRKLFGN